MQKMHAFSYLKVQHETENGVGSTFVWALMILLGSFQLRISCDLEIKIKYLTKHYHPHKRFYEASESQSQLGIK